MLEPHGEREQKQEQIQKPSTNFSNDFEFPSISRSLDQPHHFRIIIHMKCVAV